MYEFYNPVDDPLTIAGDGLPVYSMGLIPSGDDRSGVMEYSASGAPTLPESQWSDIDYGESHPVKMLNQGRHGSCVGHGCAREATQAWSVGGGEPHMFSSCFVYGLINGGRDAGASILASMRAIQEYGICYEEEVPEGMIYRSQFPQQAFETAAKYKGWRCYVARSLAEFASGIQFGFHGVFGVTVGGAFQAYRGEGLVRVGYGPPNHCVGARGMKIIQGKPVVIGANSWGDGWGAGGYFMIALADISPSELYLIQAPPDDPNSKWNPPIA